MTPHPAIGRSETLTERLDCAAQARFAVASGLAVDTVPPLTHWAWFLDAPANEKIGPDGHPRRGGFLPTLDHLPRRMFAAASMDFIAPLTVDAPATLTTRIADIRETSGNTGALAFIDLDRDISQAGEIRVRERRTIVYRAAGGPIPLPTMTMTGDWCPGPVDLFRFSAATFNAHRIHYDRDYAEREGYPALVVHGPFTACRLATLAAAKGRLSHFVFRAQAPLFAGQPVALRDMPDGAFVAIRGDGVVAMTAQARW